MNEPYDNGSFWFSSLDELKRPEPPEQLPRQVDIAIIGAGFTGLWTAYYLNLANPDLDIAVFEASTVGFGASGRNGGWCMGWAMGIDAMITRPEMAAQGLSIARAMQDTVDEIGRVCQGENIDCHYAKGGTLTIATKPFEIKQMQALVAERHKIGFSESDFVWLDEATSKQRLNMIPNYGAVYTPHCASIHPARLVRGLGDVLRTKGVKIYERTPVISFEKNKLDTNLGSVIAPVIIRATEGYTDSIKGQERHLMPLYSMMVATEPLPDHVWDDIGLRQRETFGDNRRVTIYGQRTLDNRFAFGGRAGYYFGSKRKPVIPEDDPHLPKVERSLRELFPMLGPYSITHKWGGLMGVPRHWRPSVSFDQQSGIGTAGGYTGEGVGASNLAARILTDLVLEKKTDITRLAWVNDVPRRWEPEPLRWLGASAIQWSGDRADKVEMRSGKQSRFWGSLFERFVG
ncbi:MAG: FAD-dependent oxidoreductase [bacterium]|nr:FAD-dependent oxidoreductase [Gammaproteobacteria bacterium]HIL96745.1 FAD-dependent oxidoreductase [Pseudomonadales bacterium]